MLTIRNAWLADGRAVDIALLGAGIAAMASCLPPGGEDFDAAGLTVLPGLHDHHLHILATAAHRTSVNLAGLVEAEDIRRALAARAARMPAGEWLRAVGYDERVAGLPDAAVLDTWVSHRPLRMQDRTGALWVLNSTGLALLAGHPLPPGAERDAGGRPTGRFWREDRWLGGALPRAAPVLAPLGAELAALGLTCLTDAGADNGQGAAATLGEAHRLGALSQRLVLMGSETLEAGEGYALGPLKLLIDERDPPDPEVLAMRIRGARAKGRAVAAHCVTDGELALYLAALVAAGGACPGDRIEHGGMIPSTFIPEIAESGLTVVTNPGFLHDRGDRYLATIASVDLGDLYRIGSLRSAGIRMMAGSDAPYASVDPWLAMRAARDRLSKSGASLGLSERIEAAAALALYLGDPIAPGGAADLCLCLGTPDEVLADLSAERVQTTVIEGRVVFNRG